MSLQQAPGMLGKIARRHARPQHENPTPEQVYQAAENWANSWSQSDPARFADIYAPGAVYVGYFRRSGMAWRQDRDDIQIHKTFKGALLGLKITVREILAGDNHATIIFQAMGILENPLSMVPPECGGMGVFVGEGDTVKLQCGSKTLTFKADENGDFDMSALPETPLSGKDMPIPYGVAVIEVDKSGLITKATEYYDRLPMLKASGKAFAV